MTQNQLTHRQTAQRRSIAMLLLIVVLWVSVLASGLAVVYTTHLSRQLFAELDLLKRDTNELHVEWGQYLLEQRAPGGSTPKFWTTWLSG